MVLTGGASQLTGLAEAARRVLSGTSASGVRSASAGMPEAAQGPAFAAPVGLLVYPQVAGMEQFDAAPVRRLAMTGTGGYFARIGQWIKDSF